MSEEKLRVHDEKKMNIRKQKSRKYIQKIKGKIKKQVIEFMGEIGHNGASRSEYIQKSDHSIEASINKKATMEKTTT